MKKQLFNFKTMVIALCMLLSGAANAFTAVTSGNWSSAATWGGTAPGANVSTADIIIPTGVTVTLDMDVTFSSIINTFSVTGTLSNSTSNSLMMTSGTLAGNGAISIHKLGFSGLAVSSFSGNMNIGEFWNSSTLLGLVGMLSVTDSLVLDNGNLSLNTNGNLSLMTNGTIRIKDGSLGVSGGVFGTANNYNVMYVGTSKTAGIELGSSTVQNLYLNMNSNSETVTMSNNTMVNTKLNLMKGRLDLNGKKLTVMGDVDMTAGTMLTSNSTAELEIMGSGTLSSGLMFTTNSSLNNMTIDRSGATVKLMSGLNINGNLNLMNGSYSLESGATLTMNSGSTIHLGNGTMMLNSGSFVGTASYNVEYMGNLGTNNATTGVELSGTGLNNVSVNYTNPSTAVALSNSLSVNGQLNMMVGHLNLNGQNLTLNGTMTQSTGATFMGSAASQLVLNLTSATSNTLYFDNTTAANNTLGKLTLNLGGNASPMIMLGSQLTIAGELAFIKGKVMIDNNDLVIQSAASITGYDDTHYVVTTGTGNGRLQMNVTAGGAFVTFPVGTSNNYSPAHIQQLSAATSGNIMVKTMNDVLSGGYIGQVNSASSPLVGRTWFIEAASGVNVNMTMKLGWMAAAELNGFDRNNAMIRHYTNGSWDTYAAASASAGANSTFELMRTGITSLSPFAVADASAPLSIKNNSGSALGFNLYPNPAKDVLILELSNTMRGYKYELTDITGKTVKEGTASRTSSMLDVASLKPGYYFITLTNLDDNVSGVKRFVKD